MQKNILIDMSKAEQINVIGSALLVVSLFFNWYSDKDVFRSGDVYSGLAGPLYFLGFNLLLLGLASGGLVVARRMIIGKKLNEDQMGKWQMIIGFFSMYLLIVINSIYFSAQFGLNLINKKSEIGVMIALIGTVLMCTGGYLSFRKKFKDDLETENVEEQKVVNKVEAVIMPKLEETQRVSAGIKEAPVNMVPVSSAPVRTASQIEADRIKAYENLKKMMLKDTMSPVERRNTREKEISENAFSANFGRQNRNERPNSAKTIEKSRPSINENLSKPPITTNKPVNNGSSVEDLLRKAQYKKNS